MSVYILWPQVKLTLQTFTTESVKHLFTEHKYDILTGEFHLHIYPCGRASGECKHIAHIFQKSCSFRQSGNMTTEWDFPQKQTKGTHLMSVSKLMIIKLLVHYIAEYSQNTN